VFVSFFAFFSSNWIFLLFLVVSLSRLPPPATAMQGNDSRDNKTSNKTNESLESRLHGWINAKRQLSRRARMCTQDQRCDSGTQIIACVPRMMADACIRHDASCKPKLASIRRLELPFPKIHHPRSLCTDAGKGSRRCEARQGKIRRIPRGASRLS
jgi:hypothetical protein